MFTIGQPEIDAVAEVIRDQQFMRYRGGENGFTEKFEKALCEKFDIKHALTVNSGTSALICSLAALGVGPGDEVIVPAYTWVASALAPLAVGAVPVLADVNETLTIDPEDVERKITKWTKAIIPVHMVNRACDMDAIMDIAKRRSLLVCEDACQSVGVSYKGRKLGTIGDAGAYSFNQYKNLTCGEGGALVTNDHRTYERALMYHDAGAFTRKYAGSVNEPFFPGVNYRVSEIQGAIMGKQLERLDKILKDLREGRETLIEILSKSDKFKLAPDNDEENSVALAIQFDDAESAKAFDEKHELGVLINSGRHVYTKWEPLRNKIAFHPKMNPFNWAKRDIDYSDRACEKTLDVLSRSINLQIGLNIPYPISKRELETFGRSKAN